MTTPQWLTLAIVLCAIVLFASEKVRIDIVALIVVVLLVKMNMVSVQQLKDFRGYFIVVAFVVAAVVTPPDVIV